MSNGSEAVQKSQSPIEKEQTMIYKIPHIKHTIVQREPHYVYANIVD
jgi:hypothetical protein